MSTVVADTPDTVTHLPSVSGQVIAAQVAWVAMGQNRQALLLSASGHMLGGHADVQEPLSQSAALAVHFLSLVTICPGGQEG